MKKLYSFFLIVTVSSLGCNKDNSKDKQPPLAGTTWELAYIEQRATNIVTFYPDNEAKKISINFSASNTIEFTGICNGGLGIYLFSSESGDITITDLGTTKIYCQDVEWEGYTVSNLNTAYKYKIDGTNLTIYSLGDYDLYFVQR
jgi:heat shock protein HslJ